MSLDEPLLSVEGLSTEIRTAAGTVRAADCVSFAIGRGETLGVVGESGSGKTLLGLALLGLLPRNGRIVGGSIRLEGRELAALSEPGWRRLRGARISMILQDPMRSLNPVMTVGAQVVEPMWLHQGHTGRAAWRMAVERLESLRIPAAERRSRDYPHQLSGGMRQRVMGAIALACRPSLLIADEPTTSLDVTVQAQFLALLQDLQQRERLSLLYISHDLATVVQVCHRVAVMYAGRIVETLPVERLMSDARHPYTRALIECTPGTAERRHRLRSIDGQPPDLRVAVQGCAFAPRCAHATAVCTAQRPADVRVGSGHVVACHRAVELYGHP